LPTARRTTEARSDAADRPRDPPTVRWLPQFESWPDEVTWIADRIVELGTVEGASGWEQIACLLRRNGDIGPLFGAGRPRRPVEIVGLGTASARVADVASVLQVPTT
jgi:hypothetical protein